MAKKAHRVVEAALVEARPAVEEIEAAEAAPPLVEDAAMPPAEPQVCCCSCGAPIAEREIVDRGYVHRTWQRGDYVSAGWLCPPCAARR